MSCAGCTKLIVSGSIVTALGKKFHAACFRCGLCRNTLDGAFYGVEEMPFCENCIDEAERLSAAGKLQSSSSSSGGGGAAPAPQEEVVPVASSARSGSSGGNTYSAPPVVAAAAAPPPVESPRNYAPPPPQADDASEICFKCKKGIVTGTVINALDNHFHESCFLCAMCNKDLDAFYGCDGLPYCPDCIDAAEERSSASSAPPSSSYGAPPPSSPPPNRPSIPSMPSMPSMTSSAQTAAGAAQGVSWEELARRADERADSLAEKLSHIKVALLEERRAASEEYQEVQTQLEKEQLRARDAEQNLAKLKASVGDIEEERSKSQRLERRVDALEQQLAGRTSVDTVGLQREIERLQQLLDKSDARVRELQSQNDSLQSEVDRLRESASNSRSEGGEELARTLIALENANARVRDLQIRCREAESRSSSSGSSSGGDDSALHSKIAQLEAELAEARSNARPVLGVPDFGDSGGDGGFAPPPPPPPPGAPPPPPPVNIAAGQPLKINRTGQSKQLDDGSGGGGGGGADHNPQADLINELKKGRPQLRRTAATRPSKKDILTKNANARMAAEPSRPDPSLVKGADTGNTYARRMASNAEKSAGLAVEREQRVNQGQMRMKVHRNKYLDSLLDQIGGPQ